ncbi:MAG: S1 family peptidase [Acidimicrobiia bacterium]
MTASLVRPTLLILVLASCTPASRVVATTPLVPDTVTITAAVPSTVGRTGTTQPAPPEEEAVPLADLARATVQVLQVSDGVRQGWGSGTIVSPGGLILTNAHVARPEAPGLPPGLGEDPDQLLIALVEEEDLPPVPWYVAEVLTAEGYLDLAVLQVTATVDGDPVDPGELGLPFVELGDSDLIGLGEELTVLGFPGIGGDTISLTTGRVSGFLADDRAGVRAWVKTETDIAPGNSGGLAADRAGRIVGIPTEVAVGPDFGELGRLRPINLAKPLIEDAQGGERYIRDSTVVPGTGGEQLAFSTWATEVDATGCPVDSVEGYPSGATSVVAVFAWTGMTDGQEVYYEWTLDDRELLFWESLLWADGAEGECLWFGLHNGGSALPDGIYDLVIFSGTDGPPIGNAVGTVGATPVNGGVEVAGRVADLDTGRGIPGAALYILHPGVDVEEWFFGERTFADLLTSAQTDGAGRYLLSRPLQREVDYQAVVEAEGYEAVWGEIRLDRATSDSVELEDIWLVGR